MGMLTANPGTKLDEILVPDKATPLRYHPLASSRPFGF